MQINRLVFPGFWFDSDPLSRGEELAQRGAGGFCLYGGTREQIRAFCTRVRAASPLKKILICADYEDGLGRWVPDAPRLAPNLALGAARSAALAFEKGLLTARQARALGVDWVFAPVLDLADTADNPIVNARAFSANPGEVTRLAAAFMDGLRQGGALNCVKHFPGHGQTETDSHLRLPVLNRTQAQLEQHELLPFANLLDRADGVMTGHLLIPSLDEKSPASLSPAVNGRLLREKLGWRGCILTDALLMRAIGDENAAALHALNAGAHVLLAMKGPCSVMDFLHKHTPPPGRIRTAHGILDALCAKADALATPPGDPFAPNDFNLRAARAACVLDGEFSIKPGETVRVLALGDDEQKGWLPLRRVLEDAGVRITDGPAEKLLLLSLANYKSFKGRVNLTPQDITLAQKAIRSARNAALACLGSPFSARPLRGQTAAVLHAFCPLEEFQQTAAEILLGKRPARGSLPVTM